MPAKSKRYLDSYNFNKAVKRNNGCQHDRKIAIYHLVFIDSYNISHRHHQSHHLCTEKAHKGENHIRPGCIHTGSYVKGEVSSYVGSIMCRTDSKRFSSHNLHLPKDK